MISLKKHFRFMYYIENNKTRLTSVEILSLIYNKNNELKSDFNAFS